MTSDPKNGSEDQKVAGTLANTTANGLQATPCRGGGRATSSSTSQSRLQADSLKSYDAGDMAESISVDLESTQHCEAAEMIKFLLAFCRSGDDKTVPVHDERVLQCAFEETRKLANSSETVLQTLLEFRTAKNELEMYNPFVQACNHSLDKLSAVEIEGLPSYKPEKQIVFVRNHDRSVKSPNHRRATQVKPDIVLLQWELVLSSTSDPTSPYSRSYLSDLCTSESNLELSWKSIRSTVEMKFETPPHHPAFIHEKLPEDNYAVRSSGRLSEKKLLVTAETVHRASRSTNSKRKMDALRDEDGVEPLSKRPKGKGLSQKHPVNIQNGIYAAERLSCAPDITHSINFILLGCTIHITWSDRQNVILTSGLDIVDDLPHFLLFLLILQRFDLARWGFSTEFPGSAIQPIRECHRMRILKAEFSENPVIIFPDDDPIYGGISLAGRSTVIAGATEVLDSPLRTSSEEIRNGNKLAVKFSWPEETRISEVEFVRKAGAIGEKNPLVKGHIPTMLGDIDPPFLTCSTRLIREFLGLDTSGARALRVIVFRRLSEIKYLDEDDMVAAFLDCLFCHWALWKEYIEHGDISIGNLMYDPDTKQGVLNDLDLARVGGPNRKLSAKDNTGTVPFLALDLLNKAAFEGQVPRRYRHDAESFAWCLIYICICMGKDGEGRIRTINPHPLSSWFGNVDTSHRAKYESAELHDKLTLYERTKPLAIALHKYWVNRLHSQITAGQQDVGGCEPRDLANIPALAKWDVPTKADLQAQGPYEELSDDDSFTEVLQVLVRASRMIPQPLVQTLDDKVKIINQLYPNLSPRA